MRLQHRTDIGASPDEVWAFLQDTRAVVECVPGAELVDELGADRYQGVLRIALGPLKMNYAGEVTVVERNAETRRIVLDAAGSDKRGSGGARAHVQLLVAPADAGSSIDVVSDVDLTGRIASLGRGVRDVSNRMFLEFTNQLRDRVEHPVDQPRRPIASTASSTPARAQQPTPSVPAAKGTREVGEIKLLQFVWSVTRGRIADWLDRLSSRVRPH